jgi:hypothetical protein
MINKRPPQPVKKLRSDAPDELVKVIERLLQKAPADRYQTAAEVVCDLNQLPREPA